MRLSRNRNWGHPRLIAFLERLAEARAAGQRLAGPPGRRHRAAARRADDDRPRLAPDRARRRRLADPDARPHACRAPSARRCRRPTWCAADRLDIDPNVWTPQHTALLARRLAASREVARIFVNAGDQEGALPRGGRRPRLAHQDAAHVRPQLPFPHPPRLPVRARKAAPTRTRRLPGDGCGPELDQWFTEKMLHPKPGAAAPARDHGAVAARVPQGAGREIDRDQRPPAECPFSARSALWPPSLMRSRQREDDARHDEDEMDR